MLARGRSHSFEVVEKAASGHTGGADVEYGKLGQWDFEQIARLRRIVAEMDSLLRKADFVTKEQRFERD